MSISSNPGKPPAVKQAQHRVSWSLLGLTLLVLALGTIVFWQTSLSFGEFRPSDFQETLLLWCVSTLVFLLMVTLGFMLFRNLVKLYVERRGNRLGSRIKTKLVAGALALTTIPVVFLFFFSFNVLNRTLDKWFNQPIEQLQQDSLEISQRLNDAVRDHAETLGAWIASLPQVKQALEAGRSSPELLSSLREFAGEHRLSYVAVADGAHGLIAEYASDGRLMGAWQNRSDKGSEGKSISDKDGGIAFATAPAGGSSTVVVGWHMPEDLAAKQDAMEAQYHTYREQGRHWKFMRYFYVGMLSLITLFILFVAAWIAFFLSRQIVAPIESLVQATAQVSSGRLDYRVQTRAIDELGLLVHSFNQMTRRLEQSRDELESRRRFTETILESIPTGVVSLSAEGKILKVNSALGRIFSPERSASASRLEDLFSGTEAAEVARLVRRAQRTGLATATLGLVAGAQTQHLAITVSALEADGRPRPSDAPRSCVVVVEDTSELLRAQKSAAWEEVAQRVAHEIKNPLTPITLSAERMSRLMARYATQQDPISRLELERLFHECTATIAREVDALKTLVDEFSQFARFPAARPERADLNEVVETALEACNGRLEGLCIVKRLAPDLPAVSLDRQQFRRAVVNLIENAIEAMSDGNRPDAGKTAATPDGPHRALIGVEENLSARAGNGKAGARPAPDAFTARVGAEETLIIETALGVAADTVELTVADSGHGIAVEDREKLFLPYFSTRKRGTGLGLAIVSRIVAEHKGVIRVEDNSPHGARFIVEIPTLESRVTAGAA